MDWSKIFILKLNGYSFNRIYFKLIYNKGLFSYCRIYKNLLKNNHLYFNNKVSVYVETKFVVTKTRYLHGGILTSPHYENNSSKCLANISKSKINVSAQLRYLYTTIKSHQGNKICNRNRASNVNIPEKNNISYQDNINLHINNSENSSIQKGDDSTNFEKASKNSNNIYLNENNYVKTKNIFNINDKSIKVISRFHEHPKNILHNFFSLLSEELGTDFKLSPSYSVCSNQWLCTYNLKWPEQKKISCNAGSKKEASRKAALAALKWLHDCNKIDSNGKPLLSDASTTENLHKNIKILQLNDSLISELNSINEKYNNLSKYVQASMNNTKSEEKNDLNELESAWPLAKTNQKIMKLHYYLSKEDIKLPIQTYKNEIIDMVNKNKITIIKGEPGCGKSIRIPQYILENWAKNDALDGKPCKIIVTQPRRIAAISLAERVSYEREEQVGKIVGYQVRFKTNFSRNTGRILYCTTGILLRRLQADPVLNDCSHVILDEAHERDVSIDLLMNLLQYALELNPKLKLIIMSATINTDVFQEYFKTESIFYVPGFTYPVKEYYIDTCNFLNLNKTLKMCESNEPYVVHDDVVKVITYIHNKKPEGAILCFLPGWEDISKVAKALCGTTNMSVSCLHSKLDIAEQKKIFSKPPPGIRKVILATNIAETSVTIDDVVYVVDTGIQKQSRFDIEKGIMCIDQGWISKANVKQRRGRAGRVQPGESFHLYTERKMKDFTEYPIPEILRTSLDKIVLDSKVYSNNVNAIEFLSRLPTPPTDNAIIQAVNELVELNLLDKNENLTPLGRTLSNFQMEPKLAKAITNAVIFQCITPVIDMVTLLSGETNIFSSSLINQAEIKNTKKKYSETSDHLAVMKIFEKWLGYVENNDKYMADTFCSENHLIDYKLYTLQKLRNVYFEYVYKGFNTDVTLSDEFSDNDELVKAVLLSDASSILRQSNFEKVKGRLKKKNVFLTRNNHKAHISTESVNSRITNFPSEFLIYVNETRSDIRRITTVNETSFVSLLSVLLFKNEDLVLKEISDSDNIGKSTFNDQVILALKNLKIQCICDRRQAMAILKCKEVLKSGIHYYTDLLTGSNPRDIQAEVEWTEILKKLNSLLLLLKV